MNSKARQQDAVARNAAFKQKMDDISAKHERLVIVNAMLRDLIVRMLDTIAKSKSQNDAGGH